MEDWYTKWRFKINQSKSIHTTFTLRLSPCPEVSIYGTQIPTSSIVKYLGLTLDRRLTWAPHLRSKRQNLNLRLRLLKTFCNNNKYTHIKTKLLIYKSLIKPIWTYGIQLWGNAKISNINKIQTFQNIALRKLLNAPPYVSNLSIQQDLRINSVKDEAKLYYKRFHSRLLNHPNPLIKNLAIPSIPEDVEDAFAYLIENSPPDNFEFADYIQNNYISSDATFPPILWATEPSKEARMTNGPESFHSHFNEQFYTSHPSIHQVIHILLDIQSESYLKIYSIKEQNINKPCKEQQENIIFLINTIEKI
ncbi:hypothetical protein QTP88_015835 [Uroleucon formosanum]